MSIEQYIEALRVTAPNGGKPIHLVVSTTVRASPQACLELYRDFRQWPQVFPRTIRRVRALEEGNSCTILEIDHAEGRVINVLIVRSANEVTLEEFKQEYNGTFVNRFEPMALGTTYTVTATISLKGVYRALRPFARGYARRLIRELVLQPFAQAAESLSTSKRLPYREEGYRHRSRTGRA